MDIQVTEAARRVLMRSMELGKIDPQLGGIRLRGSRSLSGGFHVQVEFAETAPSGDELVDLDGMNLFVDPALLSAIEDPVVDLEPEHEWIVVTSRSSST